MSDRYFPIKTNTACQLKWNWSTIRLYNGITSSCHRVQGDSIDIENFDGFHNTPKKLKDRQLMLQGQWPAGGCEYCQQIENSGGSSDRQFHLSIPNMIPPELDLDPTATSVTPTIVEVYFDNVCNMSCLYCWDGFSSKIQEENVRHGRFEKDGIIIDNSATKVSDINALTDQFWIWMEKNHKTLQRFHVLGGEPFYQPQFTQCLDFLKDHPCPELELNIISNLMIKPEKFIHHIQSIKQLVDDKKIKRFDLTASIDCWGPEQEYVRYGLDLAQWCKNFEYVVNESWITVNINQTLSSLTIKTVPDLLKYINIFRSRREIGHYFSTTVMTHEFLHPGVFGSDFFKNDFDHIFDHMPDETWQQKKAIEYMQGIQKELNSRPRNQQQINQLATFLDEIDRRRNLNWQKVFPWLQKEINHVV